MGPAADGRGDRRGADPAPSWADVAHAPPALPAGPHVLPREETPFAPLMELVPAGRFFEAAALIEKCERGCWPRRALHLAAMTYERLLQPAEAIDIWLDYDERFPRDPRGAVGLARDLRRAGDTAAALRLLRIWRGSLSRERRPRVLLEAGFELIQLHRPDEAAPYLGRAVLHDAFALPAIKALSHAAVLKGQPDAATALLDAYDRLYQAPVPPGCTIISYPKSGITWLSFLISAALIAHYRLPRPRPTLFFAPLMREAGLAFQIARTHDDAAIRAENGDEDNPQALFLTGSRERYRDRRVLLLVRDPRSTIVSLYHQLARHCLGRPMNQSLSEFIRDPVLGFARIVRFHAIWARCMPILRDCQVIAYEDLLADPMTHLSACLNFLNLQDIAQSAVEEAVRCGRADTLRQLERSGQIDGMIMFSDDAADLTICRADRRTPPDDLPAEDAPYVEDILRRACADDAALYRLWSRYLT